MNWGMEDLAAAAALLIAAGIVVVLILKTVRRPLWRVAGVAAVAGILLAIWAHLAVGIL